MNSSDSKQPSQNHHGNGSASHAEIRALYNVSAPGQEGEVGPIFQMQTGLVQFGHNRAEASGDLTPDPETARVLQEHARSIACATFREKFDPVNNAHDRMREAEYERHLKERDEIQKGIAHAHANLRDAEIALANSQRAGPKPNANRLLAAAFTAAITITISPTLHDYIFFGIPDALLAWFVSSGFASLIAFMVTLAILTGRRTKWEWLGVAAGIGIGIGLLAVRLSGARSAGESLFAVGLSVIEICTVLLLEWMARGLRAREDEWRALWPIEEKAAALRDAALADLERRKSHAKVIADAIGQAILYVEDRFFRCVRLPELEAIAIKAVLDGYNAGIAKNIGRVRGVSEVI
jgi:hypothetical protein